MNIYEKIGLKRIVNASGRMTALGVSTLSDEVAKACIEGGQSYVEIEDLIDKAGEIISTYTGAEDSCVTSSASAGICISIAAVISKGKKSIIESLPNSKNVPNEVILLKGHSVSFGAPIKTMIAIGGGVPIEVGMANLVSKEDVVEAINEKTAAIIFIKSHHCIQKGMLSIEEMRNIAHDNNLPFIVDAAAEEDLKKYISIGADMVIYSGAKAFEATTSGFITGKKMFIENAKKQYNGIGRPMKVGKEGIMGLLKALELYSNRNSDIEIQENLEKAIYLVNNINEIKGLKATVIQDEAGRKIYRAQVVVEENSLGLTAIDIDKKLKSGNPEIHCRGHLLSLNILSFDPRPLLDNDKEIIVKRLSDIMEGNDE